MDLWWEGFWDLSLDLSGCCLRLKWLTQVGMCEVAKSLCQHKTLSSWCQDTSLPGKMQDWSRSSCMVCQDRWGGGQVISWVPEVFVTLQILLQQGCEETQSLTREATSASNFGIDQLNCLLAYPLFHMCIAVPLHTWLRFSCWTLAFAPGSLVGETSELWWQRAPGLDMDCTGAAQWKQLPKVFLL